MAESPQNEADERATSSDEVSNRSILQRSKIKLSLSISHELTSERSKVKLQPEEEGSNSTS